MRLRLFDLYFAWFIAPLWRGAASIGVRADALVGKAASLGVASGALLVLGELLLVALARSRGTSAHGPLSQLGVAQLGSIGQLEQLGQLGQLGQLEIGG